MTAEPVYCQRIANDVIAESMIPSRLDAGCLGGEWAQTARGLRWFAAVAGLTLALGGCNTKDPEKCQQALETARKAADVQDKTLVTQWREYAYSHCEDELDLQRLDQDLVAKEAEFRRQQLEQEKKKKEQEQRLSLFKQWVATNRTAPDRAAVTVQCEGEDDEALKRSKERFCTRERGLAGTPERFFVRYWEKEPQLARFEFTSPDPVTCDELGPNRVVRQLTIPAIGGKTAARVHCEIAGGVLAGMHALVTQANNAQQYVFAPGYVDKDPSFAQRLK